MPVCDISGALKAPNMTREWMDGGIKLVIILTAVLAGALALYSANIQWTHRYLVPYYDMVTVVWFLDLTPHPSLLDLWHFRDNEHRPILPFFLFEADHYWFGSSGILLFYILYGSVFLLSITCVAWVFLTKLPRYLQISLAITSVMSCFWVGNWENLVWEKQIHEIICLLFASLSFCAAAIVSSTDTQRAPHRDLTYAALAGALATAATYSFGFGLAAFPAIAVHGILARWRARAIIAFLLIAVCATLPYGLTYEITPFVADPTVTVWKVASLVRYAGTVLSAPVWAAAESIIGFHPVDGVRFAPAWIAVIAMIPVAIFRYIRPGELRLRGELSSLDLCLLLAGATLIMAFLIALARLGIGPAVAPRYFVLGSIFWVGVMGVMLITSRQDKRSRLASLLSFAALVIFSVSTPRFISIMRDMDQRILGATVAAKFGIFDLPNFLLLPSQDQLEEVWRRPRPPYPSFAEREPFRWINSQADGLPPRARTAHCFGHIDTVMPVDETRFIYQVSGWGFTERNTPPAAWVALVDQSGLIVGIGRPDLDRPDVLKDYRAAETRGETSAMAQSGFRAVVRAAVPMKLTLLLLDEEGRACFCAEATEGEALARKAEPS
jgi:hypothetical protein